MDVKDVTVFPYTLAMELPYMAVRLPTRLGEKVLVSAGNMLPPNTCKLDKVLDVIRLPAADALVSTLPNDATVLRLV